MRDESTRCMKYLAKLFIFLTAFTSISASSCGFEACPNGKDDMLNVHIICHTHDDVGWVHTVDNYYHMWVKEIISSVVNNLMQNEHRKFIYVEIAFFSKWWEDQTELTKEYVRRLVNDGRLEFISGGWSMNDEATTHYLAVIDQLTLGLRWLNSTFGLCGRPTVGWQIDPFGHSREFASILAQMKFDALFLGRIHYQDKDYREKMKKLEVIWETSESMGEESKLFTGVLPNVYWPPTGFCFDVFCSDEELTEQNINYKAHSFIALAEEEAKSYATNHIVMTMGMDFHFRDALRWYKNLDYLITYVNSLQALGTKVNVFYSTPTCYTNSLYKSNMTWTTMKTDFLPYASKQHEYWTGYFTSRPALKYNIRKSNGFLQMCKQLVAFSDVENVDFLTLQKAMGVLQHHDAITGTEKQHVSDDYTRMLSEGYALCEDAIGKSIRILLSNDTILPRLFFCEYMNMSQCSFTELEQQFVVIIYNSLSHSRKTFVRLPVVGEGYIVKRIPILRRRRNSPAQIVPIPPSIRNLPERSSLATNELIFPVSVPPLGFAVYGVEKLQNYEPVTDLESGRYSISIQDLEIQNDNFKLIIDGSSGLLKAIVLRTMNNLRVPIKQSFYYYEGMPGYRMEKASGAYAFNPQYDKVFPLAENVTYRVFKGPLVQEVHQYYTPWISQVIRLYKGQNHVEFDWVVGPVPVSDNIGREIITRFDTELQNNGTFYTDSNGRETIKRIRNHQENFPWNNTENIAGNYYPVTSWIYIKDEQQNLQLTLLPDRAQGGGSITDGSLELMVHRRLLYDDGFGVNEALNEPGVDGRGLIIRGTHYLALGSILKSSIISKKLTKIAFHYPLISFSRFNWTELSQYALRDFRGLNRRLPQNVHVLTLETLDANHMLLRLEHFFEKSDDASMANAATVSLSNMFKPFRVVQFQETTLSANKFLYEVDRLRWTTDDHSDENRNHLYDTLESERSRSRERNSIITLQPMEIRTFILKIDHRVEY